MPRRIPGRDWAETWAHYLHTVDALGTARVEVWMSRPGVQAEPFQRRICTIHRTRRRPVPELINSLGGTDRRAQQVLPQHGSADLYPFVLSRSPPPETISSQVVTPIRRPMLPRPPDPKPAPRRGVRIGDSSPSSRNPGVRHERSRSATPRGASPLPKAQPFRQDNGWVIASSSRIAEISCDGSSPKVKWSRFPPPG